MTRPAASTRKTLLVVEDDADSLQAMAWTLRAAGHEVLTADSGRQALQLLQRPELPELIFLDLSLGDMSGWDFLAAKANLSSACRIPVVVVSGDGGDDERQPDACGSHRAADVVARLIKPVEPEHLLTAAARPHELPAPMADATLTMTEPSLERSSRRLSDLLARAGEILAQSVEVSASIQEVLSLVVPRLADWCVVECPADGPHTPGLLATLHADPTRRAALDELVNARAGRGVLRCVHDVLRSSQPLLRAQLSDAERDALADDAEHSASLQRLGLRSLLVVPLLVGRKVCGTLVLGSGEASTRSDNEPLATVSDLAHRVALAIENERLFRREQRAVRAREDLLAMVSHELRTPVGTIIMTATQLLRDMPPGPWAGQLRADAAVILRSTRRMQRLINDLLDFSQLEAGSLRIQVEPQPLARVLEQAVDSTLPLAGPREIVLAIDDDARETLALCDRERVIQIAGNLLGNALKFSAPADCITMRLSVQGSEAVVSVEDRGPGIPNDDLAQIFERYRRGAGRDPADVTRGAGLGLFIARGLVEAHGGRMWAHTQLGRGSTFYFTLPTYRTPDAADEAHSAQLASTRER